MLLTLQRKSSTSFERAELRILNFLCSSPRYCPAQRGKPRSTCFSHIKGQKRSPARRHAFLLQMFIENGRANARCLLWQLNKGFFKVSSKSPASSWEKSHIERMRSVKLRGTIILFSTENMALRPTGTPSSTGWGHISVCLFP